MIGETLARLTVQKPAYGRLLPISVGWGVRALLAKSIDTDWVLRELRPLRGTYGRETAKILCLWAREPLDLRGRNVSHLAERIRGG